MKLRASLLFKTGVARTPAAQAEASLFLREHGVSVLHVGRRALSVEGEPHDLAAALDAPVDNSDEQRLRLAARSPASKWFDVIEVVPAPVPLSDGHED
jgi:hypothetical protein